MYNVYVKAIAKDTNLTYKKEAYGKRRRGGGSYKRKGSFNVLD